MSKFNKYLEIIYNEEPTSNEFRFDVRNDNIEDDWEIKTTSSQGRDMVILAPKGKRIALGPGTYTLSRKQTAEDKENEKLKQREMLLKEREYQKNKEEKIKNNV